MSGNDNFLGGVAEAAQNRTSALSYLVGAAAGSQEVTERDVPVADT